MVVDKPAGITSHDVVARCRRLFGQRRVGHGGTLDPDATGVLLVGLGQATRLLRFLSELPKSYVGEIVLGTATSTLDASGEVVGEWDMAAVTPELAARVAAERFTGAIEQVPPMVSALKVGGRRLHELAREGVEVERAPRPVTVYRFDVAPGPAPGALSAHVTCSAGTYVRSLAADLGEALGGGAHLRALRRTAVGPFGEAEAVPLDRLTRADVRPPVEALRGRPVVEVEGDDLLAAVGHGKVLERSVLGIPARASGDEPGWASGEAGEAGTGDRDVAGGGPGHGDGTGAGGRDGGPPGGASRAGEDRAGRGGARGRAPEGPWAVVGPDGRLLAVYEAFTATTVKPAVVFPSSRPGSF
ncbi:MAG: tRNA pseudouridine(55) synthase TruB [Actinomycetota bacterium]